MTLNCNIEKNAQIIRVCVKLHNFVIRMQQREGGGRIGRFEGDSVIPREYGITPLPENGPMGFVPTMVEDEDDNTFMFSVFDTDASLRDSIVAEISSRTIRCPLHNIHRNNNL
jgi:hypothetical protein